MSERVRRASTDGSGEWTFVMATNSNAPTASGGGPAFGLATPQMAIRKEGTLHKFVNFMEGYRERYFILEQGLISYYLFVSALALVARFFPICTNPLINVNVHVPLVVGRRMQKPAGGQCRSRTPSSTLRAGSASSSPHPGGKRPVPLSSFAPSLNASEQTGFSLWSRPRCA